MGLPAALKAHKDGNTQLACKHYERALQQKDYKAALFQNYGALLREQGEQKRASHIYKHGLKLYPKDRGIRSNYANLIKSSLPITALGIYIDILGEKIINTEPVVTNDYRNALDILDQCSLHSWSFSICTFLIKATPITPCLLIYFYKACISLNVSSHVDQNQLVQLEQLMDVTLPDLSIIEQAEYQYALFGSFKK